MKAIRHFFSLLRAFDLRIPANHLDDLKFQRGGISIRCFHNGDSFKMDAVCENGSILFFVRWFEGCWDVEISKSINCLSYTRKKYWQLRPEVKETLDWLLNQAEQEYQHRHMLNVVNLITLEIKAFQKEGFMTVFKRKITEYEAELERKNNPPPQPQQEMFQNEAAIEEGAW